MFTFDDAYAIAVRAHAGQVDGAGRDYIEHIDEVVARLRAGGCDEATAIVGALHDVVEDTTVTAADLRAAGCPEDIVRSIQAITRNPGERYFDYITRAAGDLRARAVKLADNAANTARLDQLDHARATSLGRRYAKAREILHSASADQH